MNRWRPVFVLMGGGALFRCHLWRPIIVILTDLTMVCFTFHVGKAATKKQKYEKISEKKMSTPVEVLCKVSSFPITGPSSCTCCVLVCNVPVFNFYGDTAPVHRSERHTRGRRERAPDLIALFIATGLPGGIRHVSQLLSRPALRRAAWLHVSETAVPYPIPYSEPPVRLYFRLDHVEAEGCSDGGRHRRRFISGLLSWMIVSFWLTKCCWFFLLEGNAAASNSDGWPRGPRERSGGSQVTG